MFSQPNWFPPGHEDVSMRYQMDTEFHTVVDMMERMMDMGLATGQDLRTAATFATILWEAKNIRPIYYVVPPEPGQ